MTWWRSTIQLRAESGEEGRFERVVDGRHKANKGWVLITLVFAGVAIVVWFVMFIVISLIG
jgi:hypothetical protein